MSLMGKLLTLCLSLAMLGGCSATSLRCGTDGESSFVDLVNMPQDISSQSRYFAELCSFAYEQNNVPVAKIKLITQE